MCLSLLQTRVVVVEQRLFRTVILREYMCITCTVQLQPYINTRFSFVPLTSCVSVCVFLRLEQCVYWTQTCWCIVGFVSA